MQPILFVLVRRLLSAVSIFWKLIQLNILGTCLQRFCQELSLNIYVKILWDGKFLQLIESNIKSKFWDWVSDGISEDASLGYFLVGVERSYVQYLVLIVFRLLGSWWFHAPKKKSYIHKNYWIVSLLVTATMHSSTIRVCLIPHKNLILCFYHLIDIIDNCRNLIEHWSISNVHALIITCYLLLTFICI